jgi:HK97 family phage prohead protease
MNEIRARLSNDSLNSYGTRILTEGLDIEQYQRNPVLLYMHQRGFVVGQVKDIKKEKDGVYGTLVFDEATDLSKQLKKQYEEGSMRMVSVGIDILELSDDPKMLVLGQTSPTVTKSKLYEVSCVDIGANDDALRLSRDGNHLTLGKDSKNPLPLLTNKTKEKSMEQKKLALLLGLPEDASEKQILAKIQSLLSLAEELNTLKKEKEELTLSAITSSVEDAVKDRRLSADRKGQFIELGKKIGVAELKKVLQAMNPAVKPSQMLGGVSDGAWKKLSDVPADQLEAMKENDPAQYCRLFKAEYGFECEI